MTDPKMGMIKVRIFGFSCNELLTILVSISTGKLVKAAGKFYHPDCFRCKECDKTLDGSKFISDTSNNVLCIPCHQIRYCPRCAACDRWITKVNAEGEIVHVVAMGKTFHVECYTCEDCGITLSKHKGRACYPLDGHLLCKQCNGVRLQLRKSSCSNLFVELYLYSCEIKRGKLYIYWKVQLTFGQGEIKDLI